MTGSGFSPEVKAAILLRDAERCSMEGFRGCPGTTKRALDCGHRLNRQAGGDPRAVVNSPANGVAQHRWCNGALESFPVFAEEGRRRGCKVEHSGDDEALILARPMWSVLYGVWVVFSVEWMHLTGRRDGSWDARELRVVRLGVDRFDVERVGAVDVLVNEAAGVVR